MGSSGVAAQLEAAVVAPHHQEAQLQLRAQDEAVQEAGVGRGAEALAEEPDAHPAVGDERRHRRRQQRAAAEAGHGAFAALDGHARRLRLQSHDVEPGGGEGRPVAARPHVGRARERHESGDVPGRGRRGGAAEEKDAGGGRTEEGTHAATLRRPRCRVNCTALTWGPGAGGFRRPPPPRAPSLGYDGFRSRRRTS